MDSNGIQWNHFPEPLIFSMPGFARNKKMALCALEPRFQEGEKAIAVVYLGARIPGRRKGNCRCVPRSQDSRKEKRKTALCTSAPAFQEGTFPFPFLLYLFPFLLS